MVTILNKDEAWAQPAPLKEISTPIDYAAHEFRFTRNWFRNRNQCTFSTFLPLMFSGHEPVKMIQIGVFEGMDLIWQMQHTLRHPESFAFAIDPWEKTTKLDQKHMDEVHERALWNLRKYKGKYQVHRGYSQDILQAAVKAGRLAGIRNGSWDLVVIDGDHRAEAVLRDATLALQLVKPGGYLLFDDVRTQVPKKDEVDVGVSRFLETWGGQLTLWWSHRFCDCYRVKQDVDLVSSNSAPSSMNVTQLMGRQFDFHEYQRSLWKKVYNHA
jgi:hypothetical protein